MFPGNLTAQQLHLQQKLQHHVPPAEFPDPNPPSYQSLPVYEPQAPGEGGIRQSYDAHGSLYCGSEKMELVVPPCIKVTPQGHRCPSDLLPFLAHGAPLCFTSKPDPSISLGVGRFPSNLDLCSLSQPISVTNETLYNAPPKVTSLTYNTQALASLQKKKNTCDTPCWRLVDAMNKQLIGHPTDLDTSTYFIGVDKGSFIEVMPLDVWYSFRCDVTVREEGSLSADVAERNRRAAIRQEEKAEIEFMRKCLEKEGVDREEIDYTILKYQNSKKSTFSQTTKNLYVEDAGLLSQQRKRFKQFIKSRRNAVRQDDEDPGDSALNIGLVKRAAVDWDWDDDGKASDDEDDYAAHDDAADLHDVHKPQFQESDSDEEVLTKCGQQINSALESLRDHDTEDELAQFSDDDEDDEDDDASQKKSTTGKNMPSDASEKGSETPAHRSSDGSWNEAVTRQDTSPVPMVTTGGPQTGAAVATPLSSCSAKKAAKPPSQSPGALPTHPSASVKLSTGSRDIEKKQMTESQKSTPNSVRQRVIRTLSLHGGRMPTKKFIQSFNITSNKSELFKLIRKTINEVCKVQTEYENGEPIKILELRSQFRAV